MLLPCLNVLVPFHHCLDKVLTVYHNIQGFVCWPAIWKWILIDSSPYIQPAHHVLQSDSTTYSMSKTCSGLNPCYFFCFGLPLFLFCWNVSAYTFTLQLIYQLLCETVIDQPSTSFQIPGRINNFLLFTLLCLCYDTCHIFVLWLFINMSISLTQIWIFQGSCDLFLYL